jgi:hypothetical protein
LHQEDTYQKMEKEALLCSVDADEMVSQQPKRCKASLITLPFIIGIFSITCFL